MLTGGTGNDSGFGGPRLSVSSADRLLEQLEARRQGGTVPFDSGAVRNIRVLGLGVRRSVGRSGVGPGRVPVSTIEVDADELLAQVSRGVTTTDDEDDVGNEDYSVGGGAETSTIDLSGVDLSDVTDSLLLRFFVEMDLNITAVQTEEERLVMEEVMNRLRRFFSRQMGVNESDIFDLSFTGDTSKSLQVSFKLNASSLGVVSAVMKMGGLIRVLGSGNWTAEGGSIFAVRGIVLGQSIIDTMGQ